jgi:hypothetical protein
VKKLALAERGVFCAPAGGAIGQEFPTTFDFNLIEVFLTKTCRTKARGEDNR